ncbi:HdeD family acid-resistance protein [Flavobacterium succinicans]|uniref:Acid-resistance membrane protein n=1 Tax=Flavobacterium succinicans TaxID=29536 RepID=A0A199XVK4_9FLAO|nr:DUF308 domain-containing protein [Flavobacterium succinicans]OAZ05354.1 acid-resistance membrane protein [Flavobacterium succinicans]
MSNLLQHLTNTIKYWYVPLIIGIIFILLGIYIFSTPIETYLTLSILFSISFIVSGLFEILFSIQNKDIIQGWGWYLVGGLLTLLIGIYLQVNPEISIAILPFYVGFTMLFRSFQLLGYSFDLKELNDSKWSNVTLLSIAGILFAFLLLANPVFTGLSLVSLTALTFIFVGIASSMLSFRLKKIKDIPKTVSSDLKDKINNLKTEIKERLI